MKIRLKHDLGVCEGYLDAKAGDVIEVSEASAARYVKLGYADAVTKAPVVETAVVQEKNVETATVDAPADVPKPLDEGDESDAPKPGAPRTTPRRK